MKVLGIETSCDETAVAIVDDQKNILGHVINSQIDIHKEYGGVVPELAARSHADILDKLILKCLKDANLTFEDIDGFAVTAGPGLIGGVIVGVMAAKTLASIYKKPFIAINHLEAHALTVRLTQEVNFPYLLLLVSGGHCQILLAKGICDYELIGQTLDDALGEAFDKVAQMLGFDYPGGPAIEKAALDGNETRFKFPHPLTDSKNKKTHPYNFSFSGLKTAVRRQIEKLTDENFSHLTSPPKIVQQDKNDIAASFQKTISEILINRLENVLKSNDLPITTLVIAGGVAANRYIYSKLQTWSTTHNLTTTTPPIHLCTDNAAMIAWNGIEKLQQNISDPLNFKPRARWPLSLLINSTT